MRAPDHPTVRHRSCVVTRGPTVFAFEPAAALHLSHPVRGRADGRWSPLTRPRTMPRRRIDAPPAWRRSAQARVGSSRRSGSALVTDRRARVVDDRGSAETDRRPCHKGGGSMSRVSTGWRPALALGLTIAVGAIAIGPVAAQSPTPAGEFIVAAVEGEPTSVDPAFDYDFVSGLRDLEHHRAAAGVLRERHRAVPQPGDRLDGQRRRPDLHVHDPRGRQVPRRHADDRRRRRVQHGPHPEPASSASYVRLDARPTSPTITAPDDAHRGRHDEPARRARRVRVRLDRRARRQQGVRGGRRRAVRHARPSAPSAPGRSSSRSGSAATTRRWSATTTTGTRPTAARTSTR